MSVTKNIFSFILLSLSVLAVINSAQETREINRLYKSVTPNHYELWLTIDLDKEVFNGDVIVTVNVLEPTDRISLNYKDIAVKLVSTTNSENNVVAATGLLFDFEDEQIFEVRYPASLPIGVYYLNFEFSGSIRNDLHGLYRSKNGDKYIAITQFEGTYARMVFPCFDEPALKAKFLVHILHAEKYNAVSNMPALGTVIKENNFVETSFQETNVAMSTYLIAFMVSDFKYGSNEGDDFLKIYAPENKLESTKFALDFVPKSLEYLEKFLDTKYQLPKLDIAAVDQFEFGAMENWGLMTFRTPFILRENEAVPLKTQQSLALLISHELAHMWFGNQVTPEWWTYVWLSEGFARFFEYYATSELLPTWRLWDQYVVINVQSSLASDDKITARPMTHYVSVPKDINGLFDYIVYAKSSSILRMVQNTMGMEPFKLALQKYIKAIEFGTTNPSKLIASIQTEADLVADFPKTITIESVINSWADQAGYPVVNIFRQQKELSIHQKRFTINPKDNVPARSNYYVPVSMTSSDKPNFEDTKPLFWLTPDFATYGMDISGDESWYIFNVQQTGFFRVNYDEENWKGLITELRKGDINKIHLLNRAQLIDDSANLAKAGQLSYNTTLDIMKYLEFETDYIPWLSANNALTHLLRIYSGQSEYKRLESFVRNITTKASTTITLKVDPSKHVDRLNRINTGYLACISGQKECVAEARTLVDEMTTKNIPIYEEIQPLVFCTVAKHSASGDPTILRLSEYLATSMFAGRADIELEHRIISGLGCSQDEVLLNQYLELSTTNLDDLPIKFDLRAEDRQHIFKAIVTGSYVGTKLALKHMLNRYQRMNFMFTSMPEIFATLGPRIVSLELIILLDSIFHENTDVNMPTMPAATMAAAVAAIETGSENRIWLERESDEIKAWLIDNVDTTGAASAVYLSSAALLLMLFSVVNRFM